MSLKGPVLTVYLLQRHLLYFQGKNNTPEHYNTTIHGLMLRNTDTFYHITKLNQYSL